MLTNKQDRKLLLDVSRIDIQLVSDNGQLGRPWLLTLVDSHTRSVLAADISFNRPSDLAAMKALTKCLKKCNESS